MFHFLILGVSSNVSQGIIHAIRHSGIPCKIFGACVNSNNVGFYMCDEADVSPYAQDSSFLPWVVATCNRLNIDMIFSGVEEIVYALALAKETLTQSTKAQFISSTLPCLAIGNNKLLTSKWLNDHNFATPLYANAHNYEEVQHLIHTCGFPLVAKPQNGKGSRGVYILQNEKELSLIPSEAYCLQQYLTEDNQEYTVACYIDKFGEQQALIIMRRILKNGTTIMAEVVDNEKIRMYCTLICDTFKPTGPFNIQLRLQDNLPMCFEFNVRFSGTVSMRAQLGYKDVEAMIREYLFNEDISSYFQPVKKGKVFRYFQDFLVDDEQTRLF